MPTSLVVESRATVVSAGTERMLVEFGRANLLDKARQQPDKVRQVLDKVRTDGLAPTLEAVRAKLDAPIPLGYCHAGVVVEAGPPAEVMTNPKHERTRTFLSRVTEDAEREHERAIAPE